MLRIILKHGDFVLASDAGALYVGHDPAKAGKAADDALAAAKKAGQRVRVTEVLDTMERTIRQYDPEEAKLEEAARQQEFAKAKADADAKAKAAAEHPEALKKRIEDLEKENAVLKAK